MRLVKFGFRFFYERVVRVLLSAVLIIATLIMIGGGIGFLTYRLQDSVAYYFINGADYPGQDGENEERILYKRLRTLYFGGRAQPTLEQLQSYERDIAAVSGGRYALVRETLYPLGDRPGYFRCGWYCPQAFVGIAGTSDVFAPNGLLAPMPTYDKFSITPVPFYSRIVHYPSEEALRDLGYSLYGRLPEQADEVAIPFTLYQAFLSYGYRYAAKPSEETDRTDGAIAITCPDDILGKEIAVSHGEETEFGSYAYSHLYAKIVGIVSPGEDSEEVINLIDRWRRGVTEVTNTNSDQPCFALAVHSDFLAKYCPDTYYDEIVVSAACSKAKLRAYLDAVMQDQASWNYRDYKFETLRVEPYRTWSEPLALMMIRSRTFGESFVWGDTFAPYLWVLAPFGMLLTAYTILSTLSGKKRNMRLLRSLGVSRGQMAWMLVLPVLLFCIVCSCAAGVAVHEILKYISYRAFSWPATLLGGGSYEPYTLGALGWLAMFGIPLAMGGISIAILFAAQEKLMQGKEHRLSEALRGKFFRDAKAPAAVGAQRFALKSRPPKAADSALRGGKGSVPPDRHGAPSPERKKREQSSLPLRKAVRIGLNGLVQHIPRLVATVLLASVALGMLGTAFSASRYDELTERERLLFSEENSVLVVDFRSGLTEAEFSDWETANGVEAGNYTATELATSEFEMFLGAQHHETFIMRQGYGSFVEAKQSVLESYGMDVIGRLPEGDDEIALSECHYRWFAANGYYDHIACPTEFGPDGLIRDPAYAKEIDSPETFIAGDIRLTVKMPDESARIMTVVGIVREGDCPFDHAETELYGTENYRYHNLYVSSEFLSAYCEAWYGDGTAVPSALVSRTSDTERFHALYRAVEDAEGMSFRSVALSQFDLMTPRLRSLRKFFFYAGLGLIAFSAVLIYQFISFSIEKKKLEIAILRAMGATKGDVARIYLSENLLLACLQVLFGIGAERIFSAMLNSMVIENVQLPIVFLHYSIFVPLLLFGLGLAVSFLSAIVPILRTANRSPVDAIRENQG